METGANVLCSRCGTPFPPDAKEAVNCMVCNEPRPDLDKPREEEHKPGNSPEDNGIPTAQSMASGVLRVRNGAPPPPPVHTKMVPTAAAEPPIQIVLKSPPESGSLFDKLGPVVIIIIPLVSAGVCGMRLLERADDFGKGTWYATACIFLLMFILSLFAGLGGSILLHALRNRKKLTLRVAFAICALAMCIAGVVEIPRRVIIRADDLPALRVR